MRLNLIYDFGTFPGTSQKFHGAAVAKRISLDFIKWLNPEMKSYRFYLHIIIWIHKNPIDQHLVRFEQSIYASHSIPKTPNEPFLSHESDYQQPSKYIEEIPSSNLTYHSYSGFTHFHSYKQCYGWWQPLVNCYIMLHNYGKSPYFIGKSTNFLWAINTMFPWSVSFSTPGQWGMLTNSNSS